MLKVYDREGTLLAHLSSIDGISFILQSNSTNTIYTKEEITHILNYISVHQNNKYIPTLYCNLLELASNTNNNVIVDLDKLDLIEYAQQYHNLLNQVDPRIPGGKVIVKSLSLYIPPDIARFIAIPIGDLDGDTVTDEHHFIGTTNVQAAISYIGHSEPSWLDIVATGITYIEPQSEHPTVNVVNGTAYFNTNDQVTYVYDSNEYSIHKPQHICT